MTSPLHNGKGDREIPDGSQVLFSFQCPAPKFTTAYQASFRPSLTDT